MIKISLLDQIDSYLKNKKKNEIYLIYMAIFALIAMVSYEYIYPQTLRTLNLAKKDDQNIKTQIANERNYIDSKTQNGDKFYYVNLLKKEVEDLKILHQKTQLANEYVDEKLKDLSYLLYNDENWANFIDNIAFLATKYDIEINFIETKFHKLNFQKVDRAMDIEVDASGTFNNILNFINSIEESELVIDVREINLVGDKYINCKINIAVWGMKY